MTLKADIERMGTKMTGVYVRAQTPDGKWGSFDISELDGESLYTFLRSRGGDNPWAETIVGIMLGHDVGKQPWTVENKE